ncbi:MAG: GYD domain-containing protein [Candidatus Acidiferrum sp.]
MCRFSHQISFTNAAWHSVLQNPHDPFESIRTPIESLGGKLQDAFFTEDAYDVLAITEFPESVSPADLSIAFSAGGAVAHIHTSPILTAAQAHEAKRKSGSCAYHPNYRERALAAYAT